MDDRARERLTLETLNSESPPGYGLSTLTTWTSTDGSHLNGAKPVASLFPSTTSKARNASRVCGSNPATSLNRRLWYNNLNAQPRFSMSDDADGVSPRTRPLPVWLNHRLP